MSVPGVEPKNVEGNEKSFYGRSYPRANIKLDGQDSAADIKSSGPPSAIAPLLDWAKKADWKNGGGHQSSAAPPRPKAPYTPLYAFLAAKQLKIRKEDASLSAKQVLVLAKADAAEDWEKLSEKERQMYFTLAEEDAQRYEDEMAIFKQKFPDAWAKAKKDKVKSVKVATKPQPALSAWRFFLQDHVQKAVSEGKIPETSKGLKIQIEVMKEAVEVWKALAPEDRAFYKAQAFDDRKRFEADLEKFPAYKAKLQERADARLEASKQRATKKAIYKEARSKTSKSKSKSKSSGRPARQRALPKPKPLVKGGKYVGKGAEDEEPSKRRRKGRKLSQKDLAEGESEEDESDVELDDDSDEDGDESESEKESSEEEEEEEEEEKEGKQDIDENEAEEDLVAETAQPNDQDDEDPDLSEDEDDAHANKENEAPRTVEKSLLYTADFVADTPAVQGNLDDEDEDDDSLRAIAQPEDLLKSKSAPKDGIFSWAKSALMSGFKGMWARGGPQTPPRGKSKKSPKGAGKKRKR